MALYGYRTDNDLTKFAPLIFTTLLVGIIVSLINLFVGNSLLDIVISWFMLLLFSGITAYDLQKIKLLTQDSSLDQSKIHIYGALSLYLDFINIFLRLLSIFGRRK
jgi:FtsH-binding integral membrane protein